MPFTIPKNLTKEIIMKNNVVQKKLEYKAPKLTKHGSIETLTQGGSVGSFLDSSFTAGTPFGDLTFS